jgi:steroid delta-isomerase-like uncharacterized protein
LAEQNKQIIKQFYEEMDSQDLADWEKLTAPGYLLHMPGTPGPMNIEAAKDLFKMFFAAFPDIRHAVQEVLADGDRLAARLTVSGTHKGDLMGIPATGRSIQMEAINTYHVSGGKIAEHWIVADMMVMMKQLGAIPT